MTKFTTEDLVQYLYNETSPQKTADIKAALQTDWELHESFEMISGAKNSLNEITFSPREESVNSILDYAAKKAGQLHSH